MAHDATATTDGFFLAGPPFSSPDRMRNGNSPELPNRDGGCRLSNLMNKNLSSNYLSNLTPRI